ncbi:hypothetical protein [Paenibacillus chibensis]|uniref:hypothetical protein n=1 Tax=Paenibacillus chibensis TaxID=59846 RepID=UPI000FD73254|nr:hypothetical protein [Paenibacillus chibensis]MEC0371017.1 hypothetical protein [Paenibacillus chibensis]
MNPLNANNAILEGVNQTLAREWPGASSSELDERRSEMSKAQIMDAYLQSLEGEITGDVIHEAVLRIFEIDLDSVSLLSKGEEEALAASEAAKAEAARSSSLQPRFIIDSRLAGGGDWSGPEIRSLLNHLFGVNLDAISSMGKARISLYSKGQWIVRHDDDLFLVYTGAGDVDVHVHPTDYYKEHTGTDKLPADLQHALQGLGYRFDAEDNGYSYAHPQGQAIPDAFKGQTMGAIMAAVRALT